MRTADRKMTTNRFSHIRATFAFVWTVGLVLTATASVMAQPARLLVCSESSNSILRYDGATGAFVDAFVPAGSGGLDAPYDLAYGPDGHLYVCSFETDSILRYDGATGAFIDAFVPSGSGGLTQPSALTFGPCGNLYVGSLGISNHIILRYNDTTGAFIDVFASQGVDNANDLTFGPDGNLYVQSQDEDFLRRFNGLTGAYMGPFAHLHPDEYAQGLVVGPDGHLYVSRICSSVSRHDGATGDLIDTFVPEGSGGLIDPNHLVFGSDGHLYVSSSGNNSVLRYDGATGAFIDAFVPTGSGGLVNPQALIFEIDHDGDGAPDTDDVCPNTPPGLPADADGRPLRDCNGDCLYNAADIQCLVEELLNQ